MPARISLVLALAASLLACTLTHAQATGAAQSEPTPLTVTDKDNGRSLTLHSYDTLRVRLASNEATGYTWNFLDDYACPLRKMGSPIENILPHKQSLAGAPIALDFLFATPYPATYARSFYLRFLSLRPFDKDIKSAKLWQIRVTIRASSMKQ